MRNYITALKFNQIAILYKIVVTVQCTRMRGSAAPCIHSIYFNGIFFDKTKQVLKIRFFRMPNDIEKVQYKGIIRICCFLPKHQTC